MGPEHQKDEPVHETSGAPGPPATIEPATPAGMGEAEKSKLARRAAELAVELAAADGRRELELMDGMANIGLEAERKGGVQMDLLKVRLGQMLSDEGPGSDIAGGLVDLRMTLNEIDPAQVGKPGPIRSLASTVHLVGSSVPPIKVLRKIAIRYAPISKQVDAIENKLRDGRRLLARNQIELLQLFAQVEEQLEPIRKNAYLGEMLMSELETQAESADDLVREEKIRGALSAVSNRVQNLRVMEEVYAQFLVSIEMTHQNNIRLGQAVDQTLGVATNAVTVGLAIQSALMQERKVMTAVTETRRYIGDLIVANAGSIRRHTEEIGQIYDDPVVAIDKVTQAHHELVEAIEFANELKRRGNTKALENIAKLAELSGELEERVISGRSSDAPLSIEA